MDISNNILLLTSNMNSLQNHTKGISTTLTNDYYSKLITRLLPLLMTFTTNLLQPKNNDVVKECPEIRPRNDNLARECPEVKPRNNESVEPKKDDELRRSDDQSKERLENNLNELKTVDVLQTKNEELDENKPKEVNNDMVSNILRDQVNIENLLRKYRESKEVAQKDKCD